MKLYATGDNHGNFERFRPEYFPEGREPTEEDVVIILGDFGGVWFGDERDDEALDWLEGLPFTVAFVSGTTCPGGRRNCPQRRNTWRPGETWTSMAGRWTTSSPTAPQPASPSSSPGITWRIT